MAVVGFRISSEKIKRISGTYCLLMESAGFNRVRKLSKENANLFEGEGGALQGAFEHLRFHHQVTIITHKTFQ